MAEDQSAHKNGSVFMYSFVLVSYLGLNSSLNLMNKCALGPYGFSFPLLLTTAHMMFCFIALFPVMMLEPHRLVLLVV